MGRAMGFLDQCILPRNGTLPLKVGVTGGAGSGKSAVCERLRALGLMVLNTDLLARIVVAPGSEGFAQIRSCFGARVLLPDGSLNRALLRREITEDRAVRRCLENIIHPKIIERIEAEMATAVVEGCTVVFVEVPLLFEAGWSDYFDAVVMVSADEKIRVARLMARDQTSRSEALSLVRIQMSDREKIQRSDFVIKNEGSPKQLDVAVERFFNRFRQKYQKSAESA